MVLTCISIVGSELIPGSSSVVVRHPIFYQSDFDVELPPTNASKKRPHDQLIDTSDNEQVECIKHPYVVLGGDSSKHMLSFDAPEQLYYPSVFDYHPEEHTSTCQDYTISNSIVPTALLREEESVDDYRAESSGTMIFQEQLLAYQHQMDLSEQAQKKEKQHDLSGPSYKEMLSIALSDQTIWEKKGDADPSYKCLLCKTNYFPNKYTAHEHMETKQHRIALGLPLRQWYEEAFSCEICKRGFPLKKNLIQHRNGFYHQGVIAYLRDKGFCIVTQDDDNCAILKEEKIKRAASVEDVLTEHMAKELIDARVWEIHIKFCRCLLCKTSYTSLIRICCHIQSDKHNKILEIVKKKWEAYSYSGAGKVLKKHKKA